MHGSRELAQEAWIRVVDDRVHGVEPQPVEVIFLEPVERVVNEELPHDSAVGVVEVHGVAPRCLVARREELRCIVAEIIAVGPEVVVDDVEQHR